MITINKFIPILFVLASILLVQALKAQSSFNVTVSGQGETMILIPGLACSAEVWDETVNKYADKYECHVLNLAGFGSLEALEKPSLEMVKSELVEYIKANKLENSIIMGHSLGGFLSLWLSAENPEFFNKIVIVDAVPFLSALYQPGATEETVMYTGESMFNRTKNMTDDQYAMQQKFTIMSMVSDPEKVEKVLEWGKKSDRKTVSYAMAELMKTDLRDDVAKINKPVLILGSWDEAAVKSAFPDMTKEMMTEMYASQYKNLKGHRLKMAEKARHFIMYDDPIWFYNEIDSFLKTPSTF